MFITIFILVKDSKFMSAKAFKCYGKTWSLNN